MTPAQAVNVRQAVLDRIESKTTDQQFATWFRNLQISEIRDDRVVLTVPSKFHREWIATYYRDVLDDAVAAAVGDRRGVHLEVAPRNGSEAAAPPVARPVATAPVEPGVRPARTERPSAPAKAAAPTPAPAGGVRTCGDLPLTEGFDFDHFVLGACNQLAAAAGQSLALDASVDFATMLVLGGTGVGKTHLLQSIARAAASKSVASPSSSANGTARNGAPRQVAYLRGENFVNEFVTACASGAEAATRFRDRWRSLDLVCFDDLQLLAGKPGTQGELVHTLNAWCDRGTRVVFAATCASGEALPLDAPLLARLAGAYRIGLRAPDRETRKALVVAKASARGDALPDDVVELLADLPTANVRELEGAVTSVVAGAKLTSTTVTLRSAKAALQDDSLLARPSSSPDRILTTVCRHFEVTTADLCSPRRPQALSFARQVAMYLLRERTELSLSEIGGVLGGRDHTTILHGIRKIEEENGSDSRVRDHLSRLRQVLDR
jgi:chromosomal replication initiator protein